MPKRAARQPSERVPEIPGYRIDGVVGRGATGVVYRATQLAFGRRVALKVLLPELVGRGRPIRRLQREARLGARLAHPNLVASIDMGETGGRWWHAMELVSGPSLAIVIHKEGTLSERHALRLFIPLADAVGHLAEAGVVHRDIKPQNILIDPSGRPRLVDLGLAFAEGDPALTRPGGTLGTPFYVSPEQARDPTSADVRSDIWSLGATLYHAVCGRPPFQGDSVAEILSEVLYSSVDEPREVNPGVSKGMSLVLRKCLAREPARRYQSVGELLDDLERLRERRAVHVRSSQLDPVSSAPERRRRVLSVAGVVAASAAALALFWLRPWVSGDEGAGPDGARERWAAVDELVAAAEVDPTRLGRSLRAVEQLGANVPPGLEDAWSRGRAELHEEVVREVERRRSDLKAKVEKARFGHTGFVAAQEALDGFVAGLRIELGLDEDQLADALDGLDLAAARRAVDAALAQELDRARDRIREHYEQTVAGPIDRAIEAGRWQDARALLVADAAAWVAGKFKLPGYPTEDVDGLVRDLDALLFSRDADRVRAEWRELDDELARFVASEEAALKGELFERAFEGGPAAELARRFDEHLESSGIARDQLLVDVSRRSLDALAAARERLARRASQLVARDAELHLKEREAEARRLFAARRFGELRAFWAEQRELELLAPLRPRLELFEREAAVLEGLLQRAAEGVEARRNQDVEFFHKLLVRGRLTLDGDPLEDGFLLQFGPGGGTRFRLRPSLVSDATEVQRGELLGLDALVMFAGLPRDPAAPQPTDMRLARALLRLHAGEPERALRLIEGLEESDDPLAISLSERAHGAVDRDEERRRRDLETAQSFVRTVRNVAAGESHRADVENALSLLDQLLIGELSYLPWVQERKDELRGLQQDLIDFGEPTLEETFRERYRPTDLSLEPAEMRARLTFEFGRSGRRSNERVGSWLRPSTWTHESVYGWHARAATDPGLLLDEPRWPRLVLRPPLDVASNDELVVTFRLRQLSDSGEPRLIVLTVAGWHVALASEGHPAHQKGARWYTATGPPSALSELLEDVAAARRGRSFRGGLAAGRTYDVRLALVGGRGRLELEIFEVEDRGPEERRERRFRDSMDRPAPDLTDPGTQSLVVRSLEPVRLERVVVEGDYLP